ncbi:MAG TPA: thiamine pyrophosphate-binding protein [Rubrivivax sp.]|nr:thiamine pyrophosphate-binding protein [Rubrivivax sp.]
MQTMTGGEALVDALLRHGVSHVFGIPGVQTYGLFDALQRAGERIRTIGARHEQTAAYMAFGYAKATGREGVYSVVPGPGVLNTGAALCSAYGASAPVLCLTGQVPSEYIGRGLGHLHELPDQLGTLRSILKWAARVAHPADAPRLVADAFAQMRVGRPQPVALEMPWEVFTQRAPVQPIDPPAAYPRAAVDPEALARAADLLAGARHPMIMTGSGAQHAAAEVRALAELLQAPAVPWRGGRGVVAEDTPLGFTCASGHARWADTDVVIGIGSRMELQWFRWPAPVRRPEIVLIDIDPAQLPRIRPSVGIVADARDATAALVAELERRGHRAASRHAEFDALKRSVAAAVQEVQPQLSYLQALRDALPRDGFFVEEICQAGFSAYFGFPVYEPRRFVTCGYQGTLGFGYPTALGVKVAQPDKAVLAIAGDGGFMFGVQELATAVQYGINVVSVVFDNGAFGNVLRDQEQRFDGRLIGSNLRNPDFVKLAESFGVTGWRARSPAELGTLAKKAIDLDRPVLIHVPVDRTAEVSPWKYLMPASP